MGSTLGGVVSARKLMDTVTSIFLQEVPDVTFCDMYNTKNISRKISVMTVIIGVSSEKEAVAEQEREVKLDLCICLPDKSELNAAEELFARLCEILRAETRVSQIARKEAKYDTGLGALTLPCSASFELGWDGSVTVQEVKVNGLRYQVSKIQVASAQSMRPITSIGEETPFANICGKQQFAVKLAGFEADGLEHLNNFTLEICGAKPVTYLNCCWKQYSETEKKAELVSFSREI